LVLEGKKVSAWLIVSSFCRVGLRPGRKFRNGIESEGVETIIRTGIELLLEIDIFIPIGVVLMVIVIGIGIGIGNRC
jgi:hypothetical protein